MTGSIDNRYVIKLILAGDVLVGKTSLRLRYMGKGFSRNYLPTIGADFSHRTIQLEDYLISFSIWDLAGQQKFQRIHPQYFRGALGALIVWDVTKFESFNNLDYWVKRVIEYNQTSQTTIVIIGNKIDLIDEKLLKEMQLKQQEYIEKLSEEFPEFYFFGIFTSALSGENVNESFEMVGKTVVTKLNEGSVMDDEDLKNSDVIKCIYTITNNLKHGPLITSSIPFNKRGVYSPKTMECVESTIKLFDFESELNYDNYTSKVPWKDPAGMAFYAIGMDDTLTARRDNLFHMICIVVDYHFIEKNELTINNEELKEALMQLKTYYINMIKEDRLNFSSMQSNPLLAYAQSRERISEQLEKIREYLTDKLLKK
jgi:small GTP-binding protein